MDITKNLTKIVADLAAIRDSVKALSVEVRKEALGPDVELDAANVAMKQVRLLGKVNSAIQTAENRITKATKPRVKKSKKADAPAADSKKK